MFELVLYDEGLEQAVTAMLRSRFYSHAEIVDFFKQVAVEEPDSGLAEATVERQVLVLLAKAEDALMLEASNWPAKTDNDRLTVAFEQLNDSGICAVENYGYMASDCSELYAEIRGQENLRGYCFYHVQDLIRAVTGGGLAIRFSAALDEPTDEDNRLVGEAVVEALRTQGLEPNWNGDPRTVIRLDIEWQRRWSDE